MWVRVGDNAVAHSTALYGMRPTRQRAAKTAKATALLSVTASATTTVDELKLLIFQAREDLEPARVILSYKGNKMELRDASLQVYDVCAGDTIDLVMGSAVVDVDASDGDYVDVESAASALSAGGVARRPERGFGGSKLTGGGGAAGGGATTSNSGGGARSKSVSEEESATPSHTDAAKVAASASQAKAQQQWACEACTYLNDAVAVMCGMCDAPYNVRTKIKKHKSSEEDDEKIVLLEGDN